MSYSKDSFIASLNKNNPDAVPVWQKLNAEKGNWYYDKNGELKNQVQLSVDECNLLSYAIIDEPWVMAYGAAASFFDDTKRTILISGSMVTSFGIAEDFAYPMQTKRIIMGHECIFYAEEDIMLQYIYQKLSDNNCARTNTGLFALKGLTSAMLNRYADIAEKLSALPRTSGYNYPYYYNAPSYEPNGEMLFFDENQRKFFLSLDGEVQKLEPQHFNFG